MPSVPVSHSRIEFLDGLRGIAILLVIAFHAFGTWPAVLPYGTRFAEFPLAKYGFLGVQLFFLISGFVIFMTLEKTDGFTSYIRKRWLRLFPAMLICSALVFATAGFLRERPAGDPNWIDLLPGLLFVEGRYLSAILGTEVRPLEGAFWSLFVEVKFYLVVGALHYIGGRRIALAGLFALFALGWIKTVVAQLDPALDARLWPLQEALWLTGAFHYGWFFAGAMLYGYSRSRSMPALVLTLASIVLASLQQTSRVGPGAIPWAMAFSMFFVLPVVCGIGRQLLHSRALVFVGTVSYPLYLVHENMMIAMILKMDAALPWMPAILLPVLPIALLIALSWTIARFGEATSRRALVFCAQALMGALRRARSSRAVAGQRQGLLSKLP